MFSACQEAHQDKEDLDACTLGCDSQVNIVAKKKQKFSQVRKHIVYKIQSDETRWFIEILVMCAGVCMIRGDLISRIQVIFL